MEQELASYSCASSSNNPTGKNQYHDCRGPVPWLLDLSFWLLLTAPPGDPQVDEALREYQRKGVINRKKLSQLISKDLNVQIRCVSISWACNPMVLRHNSPATIGRRRKALGLKGSGHTTQELPPIEKRQLVLNQLAKDPAQRKGPQSIKEAIALETGVLLTR